MSSSIAPVFWGFVVAKARHSSRCGLESHPPRVHVSTRPGSMNPRKSACCLLEFAMLGVRTRGGSAMYLSFTPPNTWTTRVKDISAMGGGEMGFEVIIGAGG